MRIGLYLKAINTFHFTQGVWGDEIWANALLKGLKKLYPEHQFFKFGYNMGFLPETDIAIYFYYPLPQVFKPLGKKNIYLQQNYSSSYFKPEENKMEKMLKPYFDLKPGKDIKIATISNVYSKKYGWQLLEPAVDTDLFYPVKFEQDYNFDISFIGNNIRGDAKTLEYLDIPGIKYGRFGFGFSKPISHEDSLKVFISSFINLNFVVHPELDILIARPYQIAACKGFIASEWTESLEKNFDDSIEYIKPGQIVALRLKEILQQIKSAPQKAKDQRERAYRIVKEKFNCEVQAKELWRWINE